jgi:hypothetical protein
MANPLRVTQLRVVPASDVDRDQGVIAWLSFAVGDGLLVDGVTFRMTAEGRPSFTWPGHYDNFRILRHSVRPLSDGARREIEAQLLRQIGPHLRGEGGRRERA